MKPNNLKTKIFLDSGDPAETQRAVQVLGFLDGQTTNPTLISKHPKAVERLQAGQLFTADEALGLYKQVIEQVAHIIPNRMISIEVYADENSTKDDLLAQAQEFSNWIDHPYVKFPITQNGLAAAQQAVLDGKKVNMTLCFSQSQAAAVYAATLGAESGHVLLSPFIGRLDDHGYNGTDLIQHIIKMYQQSDHHVWVLAASIRSVEHMISVIEMGVDCVTAPLTILEEWANVGMPTQSHAVTSSNMNLDAIAYTSLDLTQDWTTFDIKHELTAMGLSKFVQDWQRLIKEV